MRQAVLIVDDNEHLRRILASSLQFNGYQTLEAANGSEAIRAAILDKPDLILLDLELPDMTGSDVARLIKSNSTTRTIPIIGCSAFFGSEYRDRALNAGMAAYLSKPVSLGEIKSKIEQFILAER